MKSLLKKSPYCFILLILFSLRSFSQDDVLLIIDDQPVLRSEFERIYHKNNNIQGYENKTVAEYLEMFINFKLKVHEARQLGYDTLSAFVTELAGYRDQLSKPYLQDTKLIGQMVQEAYKRTLNEVNASHIMVKLPATATHSDTLTAFTKAMEIRERILKGESFEKIARDESGDPSGKMNEGRLGWFSAFAMVLPFENAAYSLEPGEISQPVRSRYGYHIIRVNDKRPALGEIKLAHIMVRSVKSDNQETPDLAREKINNCYKLLQNGSSFTDLVKQYSEDAGSAKNGGQMRWLRSGELPAVIEDQVFALTDSGSYSTPVQSEYGWHIFELQGKRSLPSYDQMKAQLEERIMVDERGKYARESFLNGLKKAYVFLPYPENISMMVDLIDSSIYSGDWDPSVAGDLIEPVFTLNNRDYSQHEFAEFIAQTKRYNKKESISGIVDNKYNEFVQKELLEFEQSQLEKKYPEFRYLMAEYHDGILLFNIMDQMVWSKAVTDTAGLNAFYKKNANNYMWQERADVSVYTVRDEAFLKLTRKLGKKRVKKNWPADEFVKMICPNDTINCIEVSDVKYEAGEAGPLGGFVWKKGYTKTIREDETLKVLVVNTLLPLMPKSLNEVRGQVTADYQNMLDQQWMEKLREKYPVTINREILQQIQ